MLEEIFNRYVLERIGVDEGIAVPVDVALNRIRNLGDGGESRGERLYVRGRHRINFSD
jgi:hypothetical protein